MSPDYVHSYWTWVCRSKHPDLPWHMIRDRFIEEGGHGVYAAWKLTYLEPLFQERNLLGRDKYISPSRLSEYRQGLCPVAETVQQQLFQFRTNYWDLSEAHEQAEILERTLRKLTS